jgi:hypothetical protein
MDYNESQQKAPKPLLRNKGGSKKNVDYDDYNNQIFLKLS